MSRGQGRLGNYKTRAMNDLVWALTSPSLLQHSIAVQADWGIQELQRNPGLVARLDQPDSALLRAVDGVGHRLGDYFETLITTWLSEVPQVNVIVSNLQVHGANTTIGEFDLVFSRDGEVHHWELAVKYYLAHPDGAEDVFWFGPNPKDRFGLKWPKMRDRQLALAQTPEGATALGKFGVHGPVRTGAMVKGQLYKPWVETGEATLPAEANPDAPMGWWLRSAKARTLDDHFGSGTRWMRLPRLRWMSPCVEAQQPQTLSEVLTQLDPSRAHHIVGLQPEGSGWVESTRGFLVPDAWPLGMM